MVFIKTNARFPAGINSFTDYYLSLANVKARVNIERYKRKSTSEEVPTRRLGWGGVCEFFGDEKMVVVVVCLGWQQSCLRFR